MKGILCFSILIFVNQLIAQQKIQGIITFSGKPVANAVIILNKDEKRFESDTAGKFECYTKANKIKLQVYYPGSLVYYNEFRIYRDTFIFIQLQPDTLYLKEINIESTPLLLNKKPDAFNTEVYDACVLASSSSTSLFEGVQNINGLRPQLNCNICNTGDIHINGMEGAYTNVLIDGMPVIGGIASVYGLTGISSDIIEKIEISRYPGSVIYGIDNIGGTINIITKTPKTEKRKTSLQIYTSQYSDHNLQVSIANKKRFYSYLNSVDVVYFDKIFDSNKDGFTDVTLQKRFSAFHKSIFTIHDSTKIEILGRVLTEDRWGGQVNWNKHFRGSDSIYGESIITNKYEGIIKFPFLLKKLLIENNLSYNFHHQNSYYGTLFFDARQHNLYYQSFTRIKTATGTHLFGIAFRYFNYIDNTEVFKTSESYRVWKIPAIYTEHTIKLKKHLETIISARYDYHNIHKHIFTPRLAMLYTPFNSRLSMRCGVTTGFRPVQLFTEDHAALTGARKVEILDKLLPEKSYTSYFNTQMVFINSSQFHLSTDINAWYMYFSNRIVPDYSHPDKIIYYNLNKNEYSINRGVSFQIQSVYKKLLQSIFGFSLFDNYIKTPLDKRRLMLSEPWSVNWIISISINRLTLEYTGNIYGKMYLPKASALDPRPDKSPVFSIQNLQLKYSTKYISITAGIKNLLDFTPDKNIPFLIARTHDPFDKNVVFDNEGNPVPTGENPYALTFDPTYTFASMQKRRLFINVSFHF